MATELSYTVKDQGGKANLTEIRNAGNVPAVIYGKGQENVFIIINEKEFNNTHSHMYLKVPDHLSFNVVLKKFQQIFRRLEDYPSRKHKLRVHSRTIDDQFLYLDYCLKRYDIHNADTFVVI